MKSRQRISIAQTQRLQLNTGLHAAIRLLAFDAPGLTRYLEGQAADNPHLTLEPPQIVPGEWLPRWSQALGLGGAAMPEAASAGPSLMAHVMAALPGLVATARDRQIALALAEALEPSGWLGQPLPAIAAALPAPLAEVERVLALVQRIEPAGLFARSLAECLRLQALEAGCLDPVLAGLLGHLDLVGAGEFARLARICATTEAEVLARLRLIRRFDPKPGAQFDPGAAPLREPDLIATRTAAGWQVALNRSALPALRVERPVTRPAAPADRALWAQARMLGRMVEGRNATLLRVARALLERQQAALDQGLGALVPMTMAGLAGALELHESTVSRVVAGAAVDTPRGTWWLRSLFASGLGEGDAARSGAAVRAMLARLVAAEDPAQPLTDAALVAALGAEGIVLARRTLAKYRAMLHIPAAHRRRRPRGLT
ncbi:RNA polymerase factor sigma-54 [Fertoebacter nigrum]|uniref:RNA polymerase sigma-54 factor n=1 Tax=Fertoeibacter niger TaxID=2656921 RepID=A0A8X8GUP9_9RHOB|nr:RNA polymerase factor sigma-54 [Fertoeibacter niger]NUB44688.1 RNA polymerase factor sigma-54 [Fertoeibacter niger]